jgi:hypothetical protein
MTQQIINVTGGFNNLGDPAAVGTAKINDNFTELYASKFDSIVVVKSASDFGVIDSTKCYHPDGIIDMGNVSINVPAGGINIKGSTFDVSKLISSEPNYTMFVSPLGGSGNVLGIDLAFEVTGANSKVHDLVGATGGEAIEYNRVNFNNCTSLGTITNYRQGLEAGTGRFGGKPELTLAGTWLGGYFITQSIVRNLTNGAYSLFKAGGSFVMNSRFRSNQNVDLPASANYLDFAPANFPSPSTLQLEGMIITRNGASNSEDSNYTPNISMSDLSSNWRDNIGIPNTFVGGRLKLSITATTTLALINTYYDINGTYTSTKLEHFDVPASGRLRHLGNNPREYDVICNFVFAGVANDLLSLKLVKWDNSIAGFVDIDTQIRRVNSVAGPNDSAFFTVFFPVALDQNDYIKFQVANTTSAGKNVTLNLDSYFLVEER